MAKNQPAPKQPYGPGMLMIYGLFLLAIAGWCASDFLGFSERGQEAWKNSEWSFLLFNGAGFVGGIGFAVYVWILAAIRAKQGVGTPTDKSHEPTAPDRHQGPR